MAAMNDLADVLNEQVMSGISQATEIQLAAIEVARALAALLQPDMSTDVLSESLSSATRLIDQTYSLAGELLSLRHDHLVRVVEAMTPPAVPEKS